MGPKKVATHFSPKCVSLKRRLGSCSNVCFVTKSPDQTYFGILSQQGIKSRLPGTQGLSFPGGDEYIRGQRTLWRHLQKPNLLSPQKRDRGWMSRKQPCSVLLSATRKAWESRRDLPPRVTLKSHFYPMLSSIRTIRIQDSGPCPN